MFFSTAIGSCLVEAASTAAWRQDRFFQLTGIPESEPDADVPEAIIQNLSEAPPAMPDETVIFTSKNHRFIYDCRKRSFRICHAGVPPVWLWKFGMFCSGIAATLRRGNCMMMHGALLEMPDGRGVALCGSSGMGKSTTVRRWKATGGVSYADDLFWVVRQGNSVMAHPLPTWSRCHRSLDGEYFPVNHGIPLKAVLALSRSEGKEYLSKTTSVRYQHAVYSSAVFMEQEFLPKMPSPDKEQFVKIVQRNVLQLLADFPEECLFAALDGDLRNTLQKYLD